MAHQADKQLIEAIHRFPDRRVLVVGDVMLDRYISGRADRINPEAPVPILLAQSEYAQTTLIEVSGTGSDLGDFLETVQPQVHVNGPDYEAQETWTEWPVMERFHTVDYTIRTRNEISTSALVDKIRRQGE